MGLPPTSIGYRTIYLHLVIRPSFLACYRTCLLDEQGTLSDHQISFLFFLAILYNVSYHVDRMRDTKQTRGNEMTTKLIGLAVTATIGWIVVSKVIGIFTHVTEQLQTVTSF